MDVRPLPFSGTFFKSLDGGRSQTKTEMCGWKKAVMKCVNGGVPSCTLLSVFFFLCHRLDILPDVCHLEPSLQELDDGNLQGETTFRSSFKCVGCVGRDVAPWARVRQFDWGLPATWVALL